MTGQFSLSELVGQFLLGSSDIRVPDGWTAENIGSWTLGRHPSLPCIPLTGNRDRKIGWMLGYPIDRNGTLLNGCEAIRIGELADGPESDLETFVYDFGGRFLVALVDARAPRIYLDPTGSLSAVYSVHQELVASTPNLVPYDDETRDRVDMIREMDIPNTNVLYPLEVTPRHNVLRLVPNHYLDLSSWRSVRHWPSQPLRCEGSIEEAVEAVAEITKRNIAAVTERIPTYLRLTAGADSRMLLACARSFKNRVELFTVPIPDDSAYLDVAIARKIGNRVGMRHLIPNYEASTQEDLDEYMYRIAYSTGEVRGYQAATMFKKANPAYAQLGGAIGSLERGAWYHKNHTEESDLDIDFLLWRCEMPRLPIIYSTIRRWMDTAPVADALQCLDLFYLEQRLGCWAGILPYAETRDPGFIIHPMCHRQIIERMMTLPTEYRLHNRRHDRTAPFMQEVIKREWPELLEWPINSPTWDIWLARKVHRERRKLRGFPAHIGRRVETAMDNGANGTTCSLARGAFRFANKEWIRQKEEIDGKG